MVNKLIGFLGTNEYDLCRYVLDGQKSGEVRFSIEGLADILCSDWGEEDSVVVFLTQKAKDNNWETLKERFKNMKVDFIISSLPVPDGKNEEELWQMFNIIFNEIRTADNIFIDITHGFRSLPVILLAISHYTQIMVDTETAGIYYGAYETLQNDTFDLPEVPVFDLTPFLSLMDWSMGLNSLLKHGDWSGIQELSENVYTPVLKRSRGRDENARSVQQLNKILDSFFKSIRTIRGLQLIEDFRFKDLKDLLEENRDTFIPPLKPLLQKVEEEFDEFKQGDIANGYRAVKWCVRNNLVPQGYSFLRETMVSEIVAQAFTASDINDRDKRMIVSQAIEIINRKLPEARWKSPACDKQKETKKVLSVLNREYDREFLKIFDRIRTKRNDVDHAGYNPHPSTPEKLVRELGKLYRDVLNYSKIID